MTIDYSRRALALVGTPFRLQGRGEGGLDCIGLVLVTFAIPADSVRRDYRLSGDHQVELKLRLKTHFRKVSPSGLRNGDVMLMAVTENQLHLGVRTAAGFVHAHAGIGRVVETPGLPDWPLVGVYRMRKT